MSQTLADEVVRELRSAYKLSRYDADRMAYVALAHHQGWTNGRIARKLGISRQAVEQRVNTLRRYAGLEGKRRMRATVHNKNVPVLKQLLEEARDPRVVDEFIGFEPQDWKDVEFSRGMLAMLVAEIEAAASESEAAA